MTIYYVTTTLLGEGDFMEIQSYRVTDLTLPEDLSDNVYTNQLRNQKMLAWPGRAYKEVMVKLRCEGLRCWQKVYPGYGRLDVHRPWGRKWLGKF
jgi:hypothetical protein